MSTPALYTKHLPIALGIARDYFIPGADREDVRQEARIALWEACRCYDRSKGTFPAFARLVVKRRLADRVKVARRHYHPPAELVDVVPAPELAPSLEPLLAGVRQLSLFEQQAVRDIVNDEPLRSKRDDNLRYTARRKLRALVA